MTTRSTLTQALSLPGFQADNAQNHPRLLFARGQSAPRLGAKIDVPTLSRCSAQAGTKRFGQAEEMPSEPTTDAGYRLLTEVSHHAAWLYHLCSPSLRDIELILAERGVVVSHGSIRS
jgi:hypothetical protein